MSYKTLRVYSYNNTGDVDSEYQRRISDQAAHFIDFDIAGYPAFFIATEEINQNIREIYKNDKQVALLCMELPKSAISQFSLRCLIDEISLSSEIEGVRSTRREVSAAVDAAGAPTGRANPRFFSIAVKYALLESGNILPLITCQDIRDLYDDAILDEVVKADPDNAPDGDIFRKNPVVVNSRAMDPIHYGAFPENRIISSMEKALSYLNSSEELLYRIAVFHYLLGYIHPFYDGNGRLNRLISSYMLAEELEPVLSYRLSYTIKADVNKYYKAFDECNNPRNRGELTYFVDYFIGMISTAMDNLLVALENRKTKLSYYNKRLDDLHCNDELRPLYEALIQAELFSEKGASIIDLSQQLSKSSNTIRSYLKNVRTDLLKINKDGREYYYGIDLNSLES